MTRDRWTTLTRAVADAVHRRDLAAGLVDRWETALRTAERDLAEHDDHVRDTVAALHAEFPELWRFAPPIDVTQPPPTLCSQCGERPVAMVKVGTADGWCETCLDEAAGPSETLLEVVKIAETDLERHPAEAVLPTVLAAVRHIADPHPIDPTPDVWPPGSDPYTAGRGRGA